MAEILGLLGFFAGIVLSIRGFYVLYLLRDKARSFIGINLDHKSLAVLVLFFGLVFLCFLAITFLNVRSNLAEFHVNENFNSWIRSIIGDLSGAVLEEFFFRMLLFCSLIEFVRNKTVLILITSLLFAASHFPDSALLFLSYFIGGIMYGYSYVKFQNIVVPIGIHFFWNFIQGTVFGYPVSGNSSEGYFFLTIVPDTVFNVSTPPSTSSNSPISGLGLHQKQTY
ncbi:CPBP family intramembrane glutamic endopeptidase, partial [Algoriphagus sp.]|uniref:CPBP family intramembrane glutamic endopeptidase n=1 Tax=Algoriphagus sp. TaxID=1872435 RepID=UPI003F720BD5